MADKWLTGKIFYDIIYRRKVVVILKIKIKNIIILALIASMAAGISGCKKDDNDVAVDRVDRVDHVDPVETPQEFTQGNTGEIKQEFKTARIETNLSDNVFRYKLGRVAEAKEGVKIKLITKLDEETKDGLYVYEIDFNGDIDFPKKMLENKMVPNIVKDANKSDAEDINSKIIAAMLEKINEPGNISVNINEINLDGNPLKEKLKNVDPKLFRPIGVEVMTEDMFDGEDYQEKYVDFMATYSDVGYLIKTSKVIGASKFLDNADTISFLLPIYDFQYDKDVLAGAIEDLPSIINKDGKKMDHIAINIPKFSVGSITLKEENGAEPVPNPDGKKVGSIMYDKPFIAVITEKTSAGNVIKAISVVKSID